jgi:WD40 repeat protein
MIASAGSGLSLCLKKLGLIPEKPMPRRYGYLLLFPLALALTRPVRAEPPPEARTDRYADRTARTDRYGDPLPEGACARLGTTRFRTAWERITRLHFAPDGRTLLSLNWQRGARLWEPTTGRERCRFILPPADDWVLSPDSRFLITAARTPTVRVWETAGGKLAHEFAGGNCEFRRVCLSPDGKILAAAATDLGTNRKAIRLWELASGTELGSIPITRADGEEREFIPARLSFSAGGKYLAAEGKCGDDPTLRLWEAATGTVLAVPDEFASLDRLPTLSPDGQLLAALGPGGDGGTRLRLLNTVTWKVVRELPPRLAGKVFDVGFSPDGRTVAAIEEVNGAYQVHLWEVTDGQHVELPSLAEGTMGDLAFAPDGRTVAVQAEDAVRLYDVATGKQVRALDTSSPGSATYSENPVGTGPPRPFQKDPAIAFSPDGHLLAAPASDRVVRVWDVGTGEETCPIRAGHRRRIEALAVSPDGKTVASVSTDGTLRLWEAATGREVRVLPLAWPGDPPPPRPWLRQCCLAFAPDGRTVAVSSPFRLVQLWETATGKPGLQFPVPEGGVESLTFTQDGRKLITGGRGRVFSWDAATGKQLHCFAAPDEGGPETAGEGEEPLEVAVSPDGRLLAAAGERPGFRELPSSDGYELRLWELATGELRRRLPRYLPPTRMFRHERPHEEVNRTHPAGCPQVAFAPDGRTLAWNQGDAIELRDLADGRPLRRFGGPVDDIVAIAFSPAGGILAIADRQGALRLYDPAAGTILGTARAPSGFCCLAFSPDGQALLSGCEDSTILVWDLPGILRACRPRHEAVSSEELEVLWNQLASPRGTRAVEAMARLQALPGQVVPLLRDHLRPIPRPDARRLDRLLADLESDRFQVRARAIAELERLAELAGPSLHRRLTEEPSPEVRRSVEELLEKLDGFVTRPEQVQAFRAVEVLEHIGTAEAQAVLHELARGAPEARLTQEAKASLERLAKQTAVRP